MTINDQFVRFVPSALSKTDRQTHLGPPIVVFRLIDDEISRCPVASLEELLRAHALKGIVHDYLFTSLKAPFSRISTSALASSIALTLGAAGIVAPPSSTRHMSVSDAFLRGCDISAVLHAVDWSGVRTFYRHYLRPPGRASFM